MIRWVFRPYNQVWGSICTSESLRASIRVSPDFTLPSHRSPSFGSQHINFHSILFLLWKKKEQVYDVLSYHLLSFHLITLCICIRFAYLLNSLARVSRRVNQFFSSSFSKKKALTLFSLFIKTIEWKNKYIYNHWMKSIIEIYYSLFSSTIEMMAFFDWR